MNANSLRQFHLNHASPKRILSLDGGGVRGILSLAFLERFEKLLADRYQRPDFRLAEYFSLVGGTSTGSIIAAGLALGHSASELIDLYLKLTPAAFTRKGWSQFPWIAGRLVPKFDAESLRKSILEKFGNDTLDSERLCCGLAIVAKRLDTGSVWVFHNNPNGRFYSAANHGGTANSTLRIVDLIRASTAAPSYFEPERIEVAPGQYGLFVDGGASPYSNPSLLLFMLASLEGYGFRWPLGEDRIMLVSVGTGVRHPRLEHSPNRMAALFGVDALMSVIHDTTMQTQTILQWMSASPMAQHIDSEVGDLRSDILGGQGWLHYLRYDVPLESDWLREHLKLDVSDDEARRLAQMDEIASSEALLDIGRRAAELLLKPDHFPPAFDIRYDPENLYQEERPLSNEQAGS